MIIKAVCFDWGDTLSDSRVSCREAARKAMGEIMSLYNLKGHLENFPSLESAAWKKVDFDSFTNLPPLESGEAMIKTFCRNLIEIIGLPIKDGVLEQVYHSFLVGTAEAPSLFPEAKETLVKLKEKGVQLAVISNNIREYVEPPLKNLGLEDYFDQVTISGTFGVGKPDPEIFLSTLKSLNVEPGQALMVGDSVEDDILGGSQVGMKTVWVNRNNKALLPEIKPDYIINNLSQLLTVIEVIK